MEDGQGWPGTETVMSYDVKRIHLKVNDQLI